MNSHREKLKALANEFVEISGRNEEQRFRVVAQDMTPQERQDMALRLSRKQVQVLNQLMPIDLGVSHPHALQLEARHLAAKLRALR